MLESNEIAVLVEVERMLAGSVCTKGPDNDRFVIDFQAICTRVHELGARDSTGLRRHKNSCLDKSRRPGIHGVDIERRFLRALRCLNDETVVTPMASYGFGIAVRYGCAIE